MCGSLSGEVRRSARKREILVWYLSERRIGYLLRFPIKYLPETFEYQPGTFEYLTETFGYQLETFEYQPETFEYQLETLNRYQPVLCA